MFENISQANINLDLIVDVHFLVKHPPRVHSRPHWANPPQPPLVRTS